MRIIIEDENTSRSARAQPLGGGVSSAMNAGAAPRPGGGIGPNGPHAVAAGAAPGTPGGSTANTGQSTSAVDAGAAPQPSGESGATSAK